VNISKTGRFFNETIRNYHPKMHVLGILRSIRESLKEYSRTDRIKGGLGRIEYLDVVSSEVLKGGIPDSSFKDKKEKDYLGAERTQFSQLSSRCIAKTASLEDSQNDREVIHGVVIDIQEYGLLGDKIQDA
jgi:hypothetical protein